MAERPDRRTFTSNPIQSFAGWDSVTRVLGTLQELEYGIFLNPALFADSFGRDDRIDAVIRTRTGAILGSELDVKPVDERRVATNAAEMLGGTEDGPGRWEQIFPSGVVSEVLRSGYLLNFGLAEILWTSEDGMWWPRLKYWDTQFVRWDWGTSTYKLTTDRGEIDLPPLDEASTGDGKWFVWNPYGYQYAWRRGMMRALAGKFLMRQWSYRDFARFCEVHGLCLVKAIVPPGDGHEEEDRLFLSQVANRGSEPTVMVPQGVEGQKYDVAYVEAVALTWKSFGDFIDRLNTDIAVLLLGQNLTTEAAGGGLGGGEARTHNIVRLDKAREDAAIAEAFRSQVLMPWARFNFKDPELAPRPIYRVGPPEDENAKAATLKAVGDGIQSLKLASDRVDSDLILEDFGIHQLTIEEAAKVRQLRAEQDQRLLGPVPPDKGSAADGGNDRGGSGGAGNPGAPAEGAAGAGASGAQQGAEGTSPQATAALASADVAKRYGFQGLPIAVENPRGTVRKWVDLDGSVGETIMLHDYGFIEGHVGNDGEELDCYVGPFEDAANVHIVHQRRAPDFVKYDEDKLMLGWHDPESARRAYLGHRNDGERAFGSMSTVPMDAFKAKLKRRTGTGKIRAGAALPERVAALAAGNAKLSSYIGQLDVAAQRRGAQSIRPHLEAVMKAVNEGTSWEDVKALCLAYLKTSDPNKLAEMMMRARVMASLAGRAAVLERI